MARAVKRVKEFDFAGELKPSPTPAHPGLMLCALIGEPFDDPAWVFEPKLDGLRVLCRFDGKKVTLLSRNWIEQNRSFPEIVEALEKSLKAPAIVDGEIVCLDDHGQPTFRAIQQRFHITDAATVTQRVRDYPAYLYLFDILYFDRYDVTPFSLRERKKVLKRAAGWNKRVRFTPGTEGKGVALFRETCKRHGEGIVGKRLESRYVAKRNGDWVKIKCENRQEFVIGGFTEPQGTRAGLGALLVGFYDRGKLVYAGKVGTGFSDELLRDLRKRLEAIETDRSVFDRGSPPRVRTHWVEPKLIAEIAFSEWTGDDKLRHPRFEGLRMDKKAASVKKEKVKSAGAVKKLVEKKEPPRSGGLSEAERAELEEESGGVQFSHLERVVFPESGLAKGDVLEFYAHVADKLLPHLKDRPITVERFPEGVGKGAPAFWQKNTPAYYPKWIPRAKIKSEGGQPVEYALINDLRALLYIVNQNALTFHVWFSRIKDPDHPDFVLFDVDPHQSTFANAVTVAKTLHEMLGDEGVENFVKTTGKTGLHVMTPWDKKRGGYEEARNWAVEMAARAAGELPKIATVERMINKRGNRVYVDAMQNAKGKHAVPPYVLRATPMGTVSMPLEWRELNAKLSPAKFDLKSALKRIRGWKKDPWAALL